jgi:endonuclease/exonuclease/phosphatase family metal-dependent hydrolase
MKLLSCNIKCFGGKDRTYAWPGRRELCAGIIRSRAPDIVCFQEMWVQQLADLAASFPEYACHAMVDEPADGHPSNAIFYRRDAFTPLSAGGYWLSETPHIPGSQSWESACVRLANWVWLREHGTGVVFRVINTHLDHISQAARENQARLIVEDAAAYPAAFPQLLSGDMNCDHGNPAIGIFKSGGWIDSYARVHGTEDPGPTFHLFIGPRYESKTGKIDWIFMRGAVRATDAEIIRDHRNGQYPSDHYFVGATFDLHPAEVANAQEG